MSLLEQNKKDIEQITGNSGEWAVVLDLKAPTGETATIKGMYSDHSNAYTLEGQPVTGKFTHVTIAESYLTELGYPTRNAANLADMSKHLVTVNYIDGSVKQYIVDEVKPDYTINLFVLILSDYNGVD